MIPNADDPRWRSSDRIGNQTEQTGSKAFFVRHKKKKLLLIVVHDLDVFYARLPLVLSSLVFSRTIRTYGVGAVHKFMDKLINHNIFIVFLLFFFFWRLRNISVPSKTSKHQPRDLFIVWSKSCFDRIIIKKKISHRSARQPDESVHYCTSI